MNEKRNLPQERIEMRKDFKHVMRSLQTLDRNRLGYIFLTPDQIEELVIDTDFIMEDIVDKVNEHLADMFPDQEDGVITSSQKQHPSSTTTSLPSTSQETSLLWVDSPQHDESE